MSPPARLPFLRQSVLIPGLFLTLGLLLTYFLQEVPREAGRQALKEQFEFRANAVAHAIQDRLHSYEQVLKGAAGLFAGSSAVSRLEFSEYVKSLKLDEKYGGIQGIGFSRLIPAAEKAAHVRALRAEGLTDYDLRPAGERDPYSAIVFLEPDNWRNRRAIGYDMYAEPVRRAAMRQAWRENRTRISGKVRLVQETDRDVQAGFLMYLPVFGQNRPLTDDAAPPLSGWVYAPFRVNDLMRGMLGEGFGGAGAPLGLKIHDGEVISAGTLMFDSSPTVTAAQSVFSTVKTLDLFGHRWTLVLHSLPAFTRQEANGQADSIAVGGTLGSLLLAMVAWLLVTGRTRAQAMAQSMTEELRRSESRLRKRNRDLRLLSDCNMAMLHAEDEHKLLEEICRRCVDTGGYRMAWVGFAENNERREVRPIAQAGHTAGYLDHIHVSWGDNELGRGPTGTAIRTGRTSIIQNIPDNPLMTPWQAQAAKCGYQSSVALPLICDAQVLGALSLYARDADAFDDEEVRLLEELAGDLAYGLVSLRTRHAHAEAKGRLEFLANFDSLTHLPNRLLLRDRFEQAAVAARAEGRTLSLLYLDLDHFKQINDSLGYMVGDQVLVMVVQRLRQCTPLTATISRLSGDEYVILLTDVCDLTGIIDVANAISAAFAEPVAIADHALNVSCSIGIGLFPTDGEDFDTLLKHAHTAVDSAKEAGRNTYRFFTRAMNAGLQEQMRLTGKLTEALRNGEFRLHYQPQVDIRSGRIIGVEALARWQCPGEGLISPARFIPAAERSGHILPLGEWVLNEACRQGRAWQDRCPDAPLVAVNLSALQFKRGNVLELVSRALERSGLRPDRLELELTESILLQDVDETIRILHALKALGVKLSIDDFGTGYSSLSYLKHLSVDKLKIDQSFVNDMLKGTDGASIVQAIIRLGHALQLTVIAEGVETEEQLDFLRTNDCDEMQGYLFSRPVPAEAVERLLEASTATGA